MCIDHRQETNVTEVGIFSGSDILSFAHSFWGTFWVGKRRMIRHLI